MTSRRQFIKIITVSSGALVLGVHCSFADEDETSDFAPNAWIRIEPDGSILLKVGKCELGQGVRTSLPMILAEELDADFSKVRIETASPGPDFTSLGTGGSMSHIRMWDPLRQAGAAARTMLVGAAAARWGVAPDSCTTAKSQVIHEASGRKVAYHDLLAEAAKQPIPAEPRLKKPSEYTLLGTSQKRFDGPDIVTGKAIYGYDVRLPGMLHAVVLRPPVLGSKAESFDASDAMKVAGVKKVVEITRGVAVVADNTWAALKGRDALKVEWTKSPHGSFSGADFMSRLEKLSEEPGITIRKDGAGREGFGKASKTVVATFRYPWAAHAPVEPMNCTVLVKPDACEIWTPTQTPNGVQATAAAMLGLPETAVKVNVILSGGGFGRRLGVDFDTEAIEIGREMEGTPVHLYWTREDDMRHGYFQAPSVHRLSARILNGKVVEWEHRKVSVPHNARGGAPSAERMNDPAVVIGWAWGIYDTPYAWPSAEMTYRGVDAPTPIGPWRSVFSPSSVFARECFVDEVAAALGRDAVELRLEMLGAGDPEFPKRLEIGGALVERDRMIRVIELVRQKAGWGSKPDAGRAWGFAASYFHTGTYLAHAVEVSMKKKTRAGELPFIVHRVVTGVDCGLVINPDGVAQQVESGVLWGLSSMKNQITFENGRAVEGNYDEFPVSMIGDTPPVFETHIVKWDAERPNGLGEPVVDTVPPAVANALSKLAGRRIRSLPVRPEDLAT
jgi:CO/xanthine dehydrogenase Mo-binding subunit